MPTEPLAPHSMQPPPASDELARVLDETRARFVASFVTDFDDDPIADSEAARGRDSQLIGLPAD